ncbi:hypothetical protein ACIBEJ_14980 [Nonomuraea sp. NPDC050790]|uniref:hypothetical protein n=1 Tax=Nonomuraea sp. NPDC050790 TaxID=3364371 RepID=UPI0037AACD7B
MTTGAWEAVRKAVDAYDMHAVARLAAGFGVDERREVAVELAAYLPVARANGEQDEARRRERDIERWQELHAREPGTSIYSLPEAQELMRPRVLDRWIEPMRVAGAATLPGAAAVAAWLGRRELRRRTARWEETVDDVPHLLAVLTARPTAWQSDLAVRLALRLRGARFEPDNQVRLVLEMLRRTGAEPPAHDPLTLAWLAASTPSSATLAKDVLLDAMVPRLFETEGVGRALRDSTEWPKALHKLTALSLTGAARVSRKALLSGCVGRFLRGGQAADLRFFVRLHDLLDPTDGEVAERGRDYLRLLHSAPGNVAELALKRVRRLGELPVQEAGEAVLGLLFRPEGKLVVAGLGWLERLLRDPAHDLDAYAAALATALAGESAAVRERAVKLAVKHQARFSPLGAETIRQALELLPADQGDTLAAAFGGEANSPEQAPAPLPPRSLPRPPEPGRFESAPATPEELAELRPSPYDWVSSELWLDAFVRLADRDRAALAAGLAPLAVQCDDLRYWTSPWGEPADWAVAMARELNEPGAERTAPSRAGRPASETSPMREQILSNLGGVPTRTMAERLPEPEICDASRYVPVARFAEVYSALLDGRLPPYLLGTPSRADGGLDAAVLVERLEGYPDGVVPLPWDLRQALLRLRRSGREELVDRARRLPGEAGRQIAKRLTDRPAEPRVTLRWTTQGDHPHVAADPQGDHPQGDNPHGAADSQGAADSHDEAGQRAATDPHTVTDPGVARDQRVVSGVTGDPRVVAEIILAPEDQALFGDLLAGRAREESCERLLPVLPGYREVVAARTVYALLSSWPISRPDRQDLNRLACAEGPCGPGMGLLLAWSLLSGDHAPPPTKQFLWMAASGDLPGEEVGRQLAILLPRLRSNLPDLLRTLGELAEQGAHQEVWQVMTGLLPAYLPSERATTAHTRLVAFAADAAAWAGARGELPVIADLAARTRTSDLVRHARRLHTHLTNPPPDQPTAPNL